MQKVKVWRRQEQVCQPFVYICVYNAMLTREQKRNRILQNLEAIQKSKSLVFLDFSGVPISKIQELKAKFKQSGDGTYKVAKKRLLNIALKRAGIDNLDILKFDSQVATVFVSENLSAVASSIYKFNKELKKINKELKVLGAYDLELKAPISIEDFLTIAKLPSREVLLAMVVGTAIAPLKQFMYIISELAKKGGDLSEKKVAT